MQYSKEFKEQALKLSDEIGTKKAAQQLGIPYCTLAGWRKSINRKREIDLNGEPLTEREKKLLKENKELKESNNILKEALSFFVMDRKK